MATQKETYGIDKTKYALDNSLEILKKLLEVFEDGVQFTDSFALFGIGKDFYDIASVYKDVKKEATDYSVAEIEKIISEYVDKAIKLFWTNSKEDYKGIDNISALMDIIFELYKIVITYTKDGITIDDVDAVPELKDLLKKAIPLIPEAKEEIDDLTGKEIALLSSNLASHLFILFKH